MRDFVVFVDVFQPRTVADELNTNNLWGFKDARADELMELYNNEKDSAKRIEYIQEIDKIASEKVIWAYGWHSPFTHRILYWNKFSMPEWALSYTGDYKQIPAYWWYEPDKDKELQRAEQDESAYLDYGPQEIDYWKVRESQ